MGFFSNCCAVSGQSIPADCVEPCEVTAFFPDGYRVTGIYDGYGRINGCDVRAILRDCFADRQIDPVTIVSTEQEGDGWKMTASNGDVRQYNGMTQKDAETLALDRVKDLINFEFIEKQIKMVKTKYVTKEMNWQNLPVSVHCPEQGYFYGRGKPWDKPKYKGKGK
jgi:hypothetical protein